MTDGSLPPEIAGHLRTIARCGRCKRSRGFEMRPNRNAAGRVESHVFKCGVCNEPLQNSITLTTSEVEALLAEGARIKAEQQAKPSEGSG